MQNELLEQTWYWEMVCECPIGNSELLINSLFENSAQGVEEQIGGAAYRFKVFFETLGEGRPDDLAKTLYLKLFQTQKGFNITSCEKRQVLDWQSNWKSHFKPLEVGENFLVRPPWGKSDPNKKEIVINPGQGFGTGYHESTYLALEMIEWVWKKRKIHTVIDAGTGSGILSIGASLLGTENVIAFDIEESALSEVKSNIRLSKLDETNWDVILASPNEISASAECVIANINDHILIKFAHDLYRLTEEGGYLILSGIISSEVKSVIEHFSVNMQLVHQTKKGNWSGLLFLKVQKSRE